MFNIQEFQAAFSPLILYCKQVYFTWEKCIKCAYGVFLHCRECALNHGSFFQLYFTVSKCILHGNSAYSVRTPC